MDFREPNLKFWVDIGRNIARSHNITSLRIMPGQGKSHPNILVLDEVDWVGRHRTLNRRVKRADGELRAPPEGAAATVTTV